MSAIGGQSYGRAGGTMSWPAHIKATLALGLPLVGAQLAQMAINTTDVVMLGWYGTRDLAASVLATQAFFIVYIFGSGFTHAVVPIAAQAEGRGDDQQVRRSVRMGMWVALAYGILVMPLLWQLEAILLAFGQDPELAALAGAYMHIAQWGMFPALATLALRAFFSALGRTQPILWSAVAGTMANGVMNYALIFGHFGAPEMGVRGAAVASVGSAFIILAVLVVWMRAVPVLAKYQMFVRFWRPDWQAFGEILRLGLPIGLTIIAEVGLFFSSSVMMGWLGTVPLAAHGIALQLASIAFMIPLGMANAATVRIGQAYGRRDEAGLKRAARAVLWVAAVFALASAMLFWLVPRELVGLFLDRTNPQAGQVLEIAVPLLAIAAGFQFFDAMQATGAGLLRGIKDTRTPLVFAVISYWLVGMPTAYLLGITAGLEGPGIWLGLAFGLAFASVLLNGRYFRMERGLGRAMA